MLALLNVDMASRSNMLALLNNSRILAFPERMPSLPMPTLDVPIIMVRLNW